MSYNTDLISYNYKRSVVPGIFIPDARIGHTFYLDCYRWLLRILVISLICVGIVELSANMLHNNTLIDKSKNTSKTITLVQVVFGSIILITAVLVGAITIYYGSKYNAFAIASGDMITNPLIGPLKYAMYVLIFAMLTAYGAAILGVALERDDCIFNGVCSSTVRTRVAGQITPV